MGKTRSYLPYLITFSLSGKLLATAEVVREQGSKGALAALGCCCASRSQRPSRGSRCEHRQRRGGLRALGVWAVPARIELRAILPAGYQRGLRHSVVVRHCFFRCGQANERHVLVFIHYRTDHFCSRAFCGREVVEGSSNLDRHDGPLPFIDFLRFNAMSRSIEMGFVLIAFAYLMRGKKMEV